MSILINGRVFDGESVHDDANLRIANGRVVELFSGSVDDGEQVLDLEGHLLAPGLIDLQVNGGGGVLFNDAPSVDTLRTIAAAHRRFGTTGLLPTLISDELNVSSVAPNTSPTRARQRSATDWLENVRSSDGASWMLTSP